MHKARTLANGNAGRGSGLVGVCGPGQAIRVDLRIKEQLVAGLVPKAHGVIDAEMRAALDEREALIEARADAVLDSALAVDVPWTKALGTPPSDRRQAAAWRKAARVVAAYRDRYRLTNDTPLGAQRVGRRQDRRRTGKCRAQAGDGHRYSAIGHASPGSTRPAVSSPVDLGPGGQTHPVGSEDELAACSPQVRSQP
jgi:hypothetical protein